MIDRAHALSVTRQATLLELSRASVYYRPRPVAAATLARMRRLDEWHLEYPFMGSRMRRDQLRTAGDLVGRTHGRTHVRTLMRRMGIHALYQRPRTSRRHPAHPVYPYVLRGLSITRPNHVWAADITYLPMARGFVFLVAIMDGATRRVLAWRVSATLTPDFCVAALDEALERHGTPAIFNTDQGSQFTSAAFLAPLRAHAIQISRDGRGCWRDNVFVERLWRSGSSTRRCICTPTRPSRTGGPGSHATLLSTTNCGRTRLTTVARRTTPISPRCRRSRQLHPAARYLSQRLNLS